ncbi:biopolymer transporter ExbD, partial [bacterium]|nr:biopolymer transporter ExbD [bacterium]
MPRPWYEHSLDLTRKRHARLLNLLDMAPIVDILLILAVTLFVCSGLIYRPGVYLTLPTIQDPDAVRGDMTPIVLTENEEIYLEGEAEPTPQSQIPAKIKPFLDQDPEGTILLMVDQGTKHQSVRSLLETLREAGV